MVGTTTFHCEIWDSKHTFKMEMIYFNSKKLNTVDLNLNDFNKFDWGELLSALSPKEIWLIRMNAPYLRFNQLFVDLRYLAWTPPGSPNR